MDTLENDDFSEELLINVSSIAVISLEDRGVDMKDGRSFMLSIDRKTLYERLRQANVQMIG